MVRLYDLLLENPKSSLTTILLLVILVGLGSFRLNVDFSPEQIYVGRDNAVQFCEEHKRQFRFEDSIILVVLESTDGNSLLREDCLQWMNQFAERSRGLDDVREVTSIVTIERPHIRVGAAERVRWEPVLSERYFADADYLAQKVQQLPLLNDTLLSTDQQLMTTLIDFDPQDRSVLRATAHVRAIEEAISELPRPANTTTFITGIPAIRADVVDSLVRDQIRMLPICATLFLIVSLIIFRSLSVSLLSLFSSLSSVVLTVGLMGFSGITYSVMSNTIPILLLIIAAANNIHVLSRFQLQVRQTGADFKTCAKVTMLEMGKTCSLTLATTGIGFGSLLLARAELLQSLAIQSVVGMGCCYIGLIFVLPQTLVLCGPALVRRSKAANVSDDDECPVSVPSPERPNGAWVSFGGLITRHSVVIVVFFVSAAAVTLWLSRNVMINSYIFETYDGDHPTMATVRKMEDRMSGLVSLEVQLRADDQSRFFENDVVAALASIRHVMSDDDRVSFYRDYVEFLSVFDHGRALDEDADKATASLRRVRIVLRQVDDPDVTSAFLGTTQPIARVMMRVRDIGSAGTQELIKDISTVMKQHLPHNIQFELTGDAYLHAVCMDQFVRDLFYSLIAASAVIFTVITLLFRSLRIGLIASVPNAFPLVMTLGYMHLRGYELTTGNVIVFTISLGIAVDDTIHFLARYREERQLASTATAIQQTMLCSGRAIVLTSILIVSGLSVLTFSDFVPTRRFAELTAITMCTALPGDIILLPALLALFGGSTAKPRDSVLTETSEAVSSDSTAGN